MSGTDAPSALSTPFVGDNVTVMFGYCDSSKWSFYQKDVPVLCLSVRRAYLLVHNDIRAVQIK